MFKASEGRFPKSQEEFMDRIVKESHLQLPVLPTGHTYVYDPEQGELLVRKPADPGLAPPEQPK